MARGGGGRQRGGDRGKGIAVEPEPERVSEPVETDSEDESGHAPPVGDPGAGSSNPSIPPLSDMHRAKGFRIPGRTILTEPLRVREHRMQFTWYDEYAPYLENSGLKICHQLPYIWVDKRLITVLVERWREETHTFHMPHGEMSITLQDVSYLAGLPIHGIPLCVSTEGRNWGAMIRDLLGVEPDGAFRGKSKIQIKLSWLKQRFGVMTEFQAQNRDNPVEVLRRARAYLLAYFGYVLFPDHSGDSVSAYFLILLEDMDNLYKWNWGGAVLAYLYRELCLGSRLTRQGIGGFLLLLQLWSMEHFRIARPALPDFREQVHAGHPNNPELRPPLGIIRTGYTKYADTWPNKHVGAIRDAFDQMVPEDVTWYPYDIYANDRHPICEIEEHFAYVPQPLIFLWIVELYNPDRVMRQFQLSQAIPPPMRDTDRFLHEVDHGSGGDWPLMHEDYLEELDLTQMWLRAETYRGYPRYNSSTEDAYMRWYVGVTSQTVQTSRLLEPQGHYRPTQPYRSGAIDKMMDTAKLAGKMISEVPKKFRRALRQMLLNCKGGIEDLGAYPSDPIFDLLDEPFEEEGPSQGPSQEEPRS